MVNCVDFHERYLKHDEFYFGLYEELKSAIGEANSQYKKWQENSLELFNSKFSPYVWLKNIKKIMVNFVNKQVDREEYILNICKGKNVLNIGCLAADKKAILHEKIAERVWGLDSDIVNYTKGDAQNFLFENKFDVIVIGEVMEHRGYVSKCLSKSKYGGGAYSDNP